MPQCCAGIYCARDTVPLTKNRMCTLCKELAHVGCSEILSQGDPQKYKCNFCSFEVEIVEPVGVAPAPAASEKAPIKAPIFNPYAKTGTATLPLTRKVASIPVPAVPVSKRTLVTTPRPAFKKARATHSLSKGPPPSSSQKVTVFCDLDGVLADFDSAVLQVRKENPRLHNCTKIWDIVNSKPGFYRNLPLTADAMDLWSKLVDNPQINLQVLTAVSMGHGVAEHKFAWCKQFLAYGGNIRFQHVNMAGKSFSHQAVVGTGKRLQDAINVITCWSRNKHEESGSGW
jgi:hypothetical protein